MRHLYWFRNDLRLNDNPGLLAHADAKRLLLVYIWPQNRPWCNVTGMGAQRERFLAEGLEDLRDGLDGLTGSSTLSPWLANGSLSPREVVAAPRQHTLAKRRRGPSSPRTRPWRRPR